MMEEGHPPPCVDIEGNGDRGGGVVPHPGAEIEVRSAGISPPAVTIENRRERRGIAPPRAVGVENGRERGSPLLMPLSPSNQKWVAPHAVGVENARERRGNVPSPSKPREERALNQ